jgi:hypothetical protein
MLVEELIADCSRNLEQSSRRIFNEPLCANFKMTCQSKHKAAFALATSQVRFQYEPIPFL